MTAEPTIIVRTQELTAVWYKGQLISAWDNQSGDSVNLWYAYATTREAARPAQPIEQEQE